MIRPPPRSPLFPSTPLSRSLEMPAERLVVFDRLPDPGLEPVGEAAVQLRPRPLEHAPVRGRSCTAASPTDRKSTRLNSSHGYISYAVFCLKKKKKKKGKKTQ